MNTPAEPTPATDAPQNAGPLQHDWWTWVPRAAAVLLALGLWLSWTNNSISALAQLLHPQPATRTCVCAPSLSWSDQAVPFYQYLAGSLLALALLAIADGPAAVGLASWRLTARNSRLSYRALLRGPVLLAELLSIVLVLLLNWFPALDQSVGAAFAGTPPWWWGLTTATATSVAEEVVLLAVLFRGLEYLRLPGRSVTVAATTWGVALPAGMRLAYHLYLGVAVVTILPPAVLMPLIYRRYRSLLPVITVHILYDLAAIYASDVPLLRVALVLGVFAWAYVEAVALIRTRTPRRQADTTPG